MTEYLKSLTEFAAELSFEKLPIAVVARSKEVLADTMAVIAAGAQEEEVKQLTERLIDSGGGPATLLGNGQRAGLLQAALINGTAGTFLELDEGNQFGRGHPAIHVVPAVLAMAEKEHRSGRDLILALVLGYEIGTRIGIAAKIRMSMHPHGTWGTTGAATAVGKLAGYSANEFRQIINLSSCLALATSRKTMLEGATVRNVYSGVSNQLGLLAHQLVASGFTGEADGLRTIYGTVISETFDADAMIEQLGERYEIARNYFKRHACCRYNHASLDALLTIIGRCPNGCLDPNKIREIRVNTYSLAAQLSDPSPRNMLAGKFSIPFALATTIFHNHAGQESFSPTVINNPVVQELARKVKVVEDPALTAMMPAYRPAEVRVTFIDGSVEMAMALVNKGDVEDPYSIDELQHKYFSLAGPVWGDRTSTVVYEMIQRLEELSDINSLTALLQCDRKDE